MKWIILAIFLFSAIYIQRRGKVKHAFFRQFFDHSTLMAPVNVIMYWFSKVPTTPYLSSEYFKDLKVLEENWEVIRGEAIQLAEKGGIKASSSYNDVGFNSFFKTGWKRFYLKWYENGHPSAMDLCPKTTELVRGLDSVKAAMFTELPPGSRLVRHRDPYAGSLRYHLGLVTPNDDRCFIDVDGERYSWRDGQGVMFDETYIHYAENGTDENRIILLCDIERPMTARWAQAFNHWFARNVMTAASSPNDEADRTGGINKAFHYIYQVRMVAKNLKKKNRQIYYILKWLILGGLLYWIFLAGFFSH
ncbi:lipid A hydroxylase LpxO [Aquirhabdus parva]|uniref:Lipid A hydroxylase LpxO n=1 Tax=Aquirhabdus parva TaxID=2283318 RepID=A0A345PAH7_9GAMM|nr:lipid A hydroxylase LpxO [Aquirhabdus parva]AXI04286.1 lipid A hydroxylase LpxO [Aquirhabdus parva]